MAKRQEKLCELLEANRQEIESGELVVYLINDGLFFTNDLGLLYMTLEQIPEITNFSVEYLKKLLD